MTRPKTFARGTRAGASSLHPSLFALFLTRAARIIVASSFFPTHVICMLIHPLIIVSLVPLLISRGGRIRRLQENNIESNEGGRSR